MAVQSEPLDSTLWFERIEKIARGDLGDVERSLRHASHLLQLAPLPFRDLVRLAVDEDRFEAMLAAGDFDTAARYLAAEPAALTINASKSGSFARATISCVILDRAISGTGDTVAEAALRAWTTCLLALREGYSQVSDPLPPGRTAQSERDRRLS